MRRPRRSHADRPDHPPAVGAERVGALRPRPRNRAQRVHDQRDHDRRDHHREHDHGDDQAVPRQLDHVGHGLLAVLADHVIAHPGDQHQDPDEPVDHGRDRLPTSWASTGSRLPPSRPSTLATCSTRRAGARGRAQVAEDAAGPPATHPRHPRPRARGRPPRARRAQLPVRRRHRPDGRDSLEGHLRAARGGHRRLPSRGQHAREPRGEECLRELRGCSSTELAHVSPLLTARAAPDAVGPHVRQRALWGRHRAAPARGGGRAAPRGLPRRGGGERRPPRRARDDRHRRERARGALWQARRPARRSGQRGDLDRGLRRAQGGPARAQVARARREAAIVFAADKISRVRELPSRLELRLSRDHARTSSTTTGRAS